MRFLLLFFIPFWLFSATEVFRIERGDGSEIEGYLSRPDGESKGPLVVFIDGSFDASVFQNHMKLAARFNPQQIALLSIEKRGISKEEIDWTEYRQHDCFEERLRDQTLLLKEIEGWGFSGAVLLGGSEGGKIAPRLGLSLPHLVKGMALIGSGGGLPFGDEMKFQSDQLIAKMNPLKRWVYKAKGAAMTADKIDEFHQKILANQNSLEMAGPKAWKWWASYLKYDLLADLLTVDVPILMMHGEADPLVPIESADRVKEAFDQAHKENLDYVRYADLGHGMDERSYVDLIAWLKNFGKP